MKAGIGPPLVLAGLVFVGASVAPTGQTKQPVALPQPGVPQVLTMEAKFVRAAYNNEGYAILGYQAANRSLGEEATGRRLRNYDAFWIGLNAAGDP